MENSELHKNVLKFGYWAALSTAVLTIITFTVAMLTPPLSGPFCEENCFQYPFTEIASRFPRDYYWMYLAIVLSFLYLLMMLAIHQSTKNEKKLFSLDFFMFFFHRVIKGNDKMGITHIMKIEVSLFSTFLQ